VKSNSQKILEREKREKLETWKSRPKLLKNVDKLFKRTEQP